MIPDISASEINDDLRLKILALQWTHAKEDEACANRKRLDIESEICELIPGQDEGTIVCHLDGFNIHLTRKLIRTVDDQLYRDVLYAFAPDTTPIKYKAYVDVTRLRDIGKNKPVLAVLCHSFITVKPAKPSIKIEITGGDTE